MRKLDQITRSPLEDICVLLREVHGVPHVELRVYYPPGRPGDDPTPGLERIAVPVDVLPDLVRVLTETLERLAQDGVVDAAPQGPATEAAEAGLRGTGRCDSRRERRVPLKLRVGCGLVGAKDMSSSKVVTGETKDVSNGGLQVWLPERFSLLSRLEVYMRVAGLNFHGRAEVVGADVHSTHGEYRHSLRWLDLTPRAKAALSQVIPPS